MFRSRILVDTLYYFSHFTQNKGKKYLSVGLYELLQKSIQMGQSLRGSKVIIDHTLTQNPLRQVEQQNSLTSVSFGLCTTHPFNAIFYFKVLQLFQQMPSICGLDGVLILLQGDDRKPIAYTSRWFQDSETTYSQRGEKECLESCLGVRVSQGICRVSRVSSQLRMTNCTYIKQQRFTVFLKVQKTLPSNMQTC